MTGRGICVELHIPLFKEITDQIRSDIRFHERLMIVERHQWFPYAVPKVGIPSRQFSNIDFNERNVLLVIVIHNELIERKNRGTDPNNRLDSLSVI